MTLTAKLSDFLLPLPPPPSSPRMTACPVTGCKIGTKRRRLLMHLNKDIHLGVDELTKQKLINDIHKMSKEDAKYSSLFQRCRLSSLSDFAPFDS